jgi:hypothetical protein
VEGPAFLWPQISFEPTAGPSTAKILRFADELLRSG